MVRPMPELPDVEAYLHALAPRVVGVRLERVKLLHPFVLRSVEPPLATANGRQVTGVRRVGKRIVLALEGDLFLLIHLMIAGRLHWKEPGARGAVKQGLAAFEVESGMLVLTAAGTKRRAAIHLVQGEWALGEHDAGGIDVFAADPAAFRAALETENHTLKRALTDPRLLSGIGNAYSDEILHRAALSPVTLTSRLTPGAMDRLHAAVQEVLGEGGNRLRCAAKGPFPEKVPAFPTGTAVHGRHG